MLSTTSDYAIRAVLVLAREPHGISVRADQVADAIGAPRNYLAKTLNALAKAGIVNSLRGPLGGFALAIAPEKLTVAQVADCFDEPRPRTRCMLGTAPCNSARPCAAHIQWQRLTEARRAPLESTTFAQLICQPRTVLPTP